MTGVSVEYSLSLKSGELAMIRFFEIWFYRAYRYLPCCQGGESEREERGDKQHFDFEK
jgi:hypothetical protein